MPFCIFCLNCCISLSPTIDINTYHISLYICQDTCSEMEFQCGNGTCIPADQMCNNVDNCGDASDEIGCKYSFTWGWGWGWASK